MTDKAEASIPTWQERLAGAPQRYVDSECRAMVAEIADLRAALKAQPAPTEAQGEDSARPSKMYQRITAPGQVKVGDKLRFNIGDDTHLVTAKQLLHAGTEKEEIIYNKRQNYYLITSMAIANRGSQKNCEYLAAPQPQEKPCPSK